MEGGTHHRRPPCSPWGAGCEMSLNGEGEGGLGRGRRRGGEWPRWRARSVDRAWDKSESTTSRTLETA